MAVVDMAANWGNWRSWIAIFFVKGSGRQK